MIFEFRQRVAAAIWPAEFDELRRATITFAVLLHDAASTFMEHSDKKDDRYWPNKFYKAGGFNPNYTRDLAKYEAWLEKCFGLVKDATRAANWFADVVRRDINPMFFAERGKFVVIEGLFMDFKYRASVPEFTKEKQDKLPEALFEKEA